MWQGDFVVLEPGIAPFLLPASKMVPSFPGWAPDSRGSRLLSVRLDTWGLWEGCTQGCALPTWNHLVVEKWPLQGLLENTDYMSGR